MALRVLLVQNSLSDAEPCLRVLKESGIELRADIVLSPEEFAEHLLQNAYDIIVADSRLNGWTGLGALRRMQELGREIPFVLVTSTLGEEAAVECIKQGVNDYVFKDKLARLPVAVERVLAEKARQAELARADQATRRAQERFELLARATSDAVRDWDVTTDKVWWNEGVSLLFGYSPEEINPGSAWWKERIHPDDQAHVLSGFHAILGGGSFSWSDEYRFRCADGSYAVVFDRGYILRSAEGKAVRMLGAMMDLTERKRAEEARRHSETRYRELFDNATYGIYLSTPSGKFLDVNPALARMLGYDSKDELLAREPATEIYRDPEVRAWILAQFQDKGQIEGAEVEWKGKDGRIISVRLSGRAVAGAHGGVEELEVFVEDITERRNLERHFRQVQKFEAIGQLAGGIAHDFNNVMGAILGWAELGQEQATPDSPLHNHFCKIRHQTERAAGLTQQLLAFARRQLLEPRNLNLNQIVTDTLSLLEKVIGSDIELETVLAAELAGVFADPTQIEQVVMNLCLNGRDAMPAGGRLLIETQNVELDEEYYHIHSYARPGRYVQLSVSDTGVGMDAVTLEHIFDPFFTTKEPGKGTGLGLATVYGVVKQHNGFLHVYSEPSRGTVFRVYLPVATVSQEEMKGPGRIPPEQVRGGSETILVAEDHDGVREMARMTLESYGYRLILATNGAEALELFLGHSDSISLVLLDVVMPRLGGPEAYLQMSAAKPDVPALFTTGYSAEAHGLAPLMEEGAAVLQKPYSPAVLARKVREILDRAARPANIPEPSSPHSA